MIKLRQIKVSILNDTKEELIRKICKKEESFNNHYNINYITYNILFGMCFKTKRFD